MNLCCTQVVVGSFAAVLSAAAATVVWLPNYSDMANQRREAIRTGEAEAPKKMAPGSVRRYLL